MSEYPIYHTACSYIHTCSHSSYQLIRVRCCSACSNPTGCNDVGLLHFVHLRIVRVDVCAGGIGDGQGVAAGAGSARRKAADMCRVLELLK